MGRNVFNTPSHSMYMKKIELLALSLIFLAFMISVYVYPLMPQEIATHWGASGKADGFMDKGIGLFLLPIITAGIFLLLKLIPKIDPLKKNIEKFQKQFDGFILLMTNFMLYIHILSVAWNLGYKFDMGTYMLPALGLLFYYIGILNENSKRNWFIGIRTPWTISSDVVWNKTHKLGGILFKACGVIAFASILVPGYSIYFVIGPVILSSIYLFIYSYLEYQKEMKK